MPPDPSRRLDDAIRGRKVLITGAGSGMGRAYALDLARRGVDVVVNDIDAAAAHRVVSEAAPGVGRALAIPADIANWREAERLVIQADEALSGLDCVINNAGILHVAPAGEELEESVRRAIEVNLMGSIFVGTHAIHLMRGRGHGLVINTSSNAYLGAPGIATYASTKGAIVSLGYSWAIELAGTGVDLVTFAPRAFTRMTERRGDAEVGERHLPEHVAPAVAALLAMPQGAAHGQVVAFDGRRLVITGRPQLRSVLELDVSGDNAVLIRDALASGVSAANA